MNRLLTTDEIEYLRSNIDNYKSNKELGNKFGLTRKQISDILHNNKIRRSFTTNGKVKFNENFFSEYNELSCYWAGFITADGSIGIRPNLKDSFLTIVSQLSDQNHLELFLKQIESENLKIIHRKTSAIKNGIKYENCAVILYKTKIASDLNDFFSIKQRKTLNTIFPENMPEQYHLDYIRGYIDGDGSISVYKDKGILNISLSYVGNKEFIVKLADLIGVPYYLVNCKNNLFCISYSKFNSIRAIKKIYFPESKMCLHRKRNKYFEYINNITEIQKTRLINYLRKFNEQL